MSDFVGYVANTGEKFTGSFTSEGAVGPIGPAGPQGYNPVRGVDYWTDADKAEVVEEATSEIGDQIEEYNSNATAKTAAFDENATNKTNAFNDNAASLTATFVEIADGKTADFNNNASDKTDAYNLNATTKTGAYDDNASSKTTEFNDNASTKTTTFNSNATSKTDTYNSNASDKLSAYNSNATSKTNDYDTNATNKLGTYNTNHTEKMAAYNDNAAEKTADFDEHVSNFYTKTEIDDKVSHIGAMSVNLFDYTDESVYTNKYYKYDSTTGEVQLKSDNTYNCGIFKVPGPGSYTVTSTGLTTILLNGNKEYVTTQAATSTPKTITFSYSQVRYIAVSWKKSKADITEYMAVSGETLPESYVPYRFDLKDDIVLTDAQIAEVEAHIAQSKPEEYVVDVNGNGDYTSFIGCLRDLQGNEREKIITIMPGTYDVFEEYGGAEWHTDEENQEKDYHELCPFVPKNTTIVGIGEVVLRYRPSSTDTTNYMCTQISPLNIQETATVKNLKIDCDYCRYAIHMETGDTHINANVVLENLYIDKRNSAGYSQAVGCGGTSGLNFIVNNCYIYGRLGGFSIHDNGVTGSNGMNIYITNSILLRRADANTRYALRFSGVNDTNLHNVYIANSYFGEMRLSSEISDSPTAKNGYQIKVLNCNDYNVSYKYETNNEHQIENFNTTILNIDNQGSGTYN